MTTDTRSRAVARPASVQRQFRATPVAMGIAVALSMGALPTTTLAHTASVGTVAALQAAIATAQADGADDTITLTGNISFAAASDAIAINVTDGKTLTIQGGGFTLSGGGLARVLTVATAGAGSAVAIDNLVITGGFFGGAGGPPGAINVTGGHALGAGVFNSGALLISRSTLSAHRAGGGGGGGGNGGAGAGPGTFGGGNPGLAAPAVPPGFAAGSAGGTAISGVNQVAGGFGGFGEVGYCGSNGGNAAAAIYNSGTLTISDSFITNNVAAGGGYGRCANGGSAVGGIWNAGGTLKIDSSSTASLNTGNVGGAVGGGTSVNTQWTTGGGATSTSFAPPTITSASFDASTGLLSVTATNLAMGDSIVMSRLSLTGQGGSYTLTTGNVTAGSATAFSATLNTTDRLALAGLLNRNGTQSVDNTVFNLSATAYWNTNTLASADLVNNPVTVSNVSVVAFSGTTATGTGPASASFTGGGPACSFDVPNTSFVAATQPYPGGLGHFSHGWFRFKLTGCTAGSTVRVNVTWPSLAGLTYRKYGPTPTSAGASVFYAPTNMGIAGNVVTYDVTDGALGDDDLLANGVIVDPGGPLGLDGTVPVPTLDARALATLALMLLAVAGWVTRKRAKWL